MAGGVRTGQAVFKLFMWVFRKLEDPAAASAELYQSILHTVNQVHRPSEGDGSWSPSHRAANPRRASRRSQVSYPLLLGRCRIADAELHCSAGSLHGRSASYGNLLVQ